MRLALIGLVAAPASMTAARMALRPMLFIVRQERKQVLGDPPDFERVMMDTLGAHLEGALDAKGFISVAGSAQGCLVRPPLQSYTGRR